MQGPGPLGASGEVPLEPGGGGCTGALGGRPGICTWGPAWPAGPTHLKEEAWGTEAPAPGPQLPASSTPATGHTAAHPSPALPTPPGSAQATPSARAPPAPSSSSETASSGGTLAFLTPAVPTTPQVFSAAKRLPRQPFPLGCGAPADLCLLAEPGSHTRGPPANASALIPSLSRAGRTPSLHPQRRPCSRARHERLETQQSESSPPMRPRRCATGQAACCVVSAPSREVCKAGLGAGRALGLPWLWGLCRDADGTPGAGPRAGGPGRWGRGSGCLMSGQAVQSRPSHFWCQ